MAFSAFKDFSADVSSAIEPKMPHKIKQVEEKNELRSTDTTAYTQRTAIESYLVCKGYVSEDRMESRQFGDDVDCVLASELLALALLRSVTHENAGPPTPVLFTRRAVVDRQVKMRRRED